MTRTPVVGITHEIVLSDGTTTLGFRPAFLDGSIDPDMGTFRRDPLSRFALKTSVGEQKYSDLEPPYNTTAQDDWRGGRGQEVMDDKQRFYDSYNLWTQTKRQIIAGMMQSSAAGEDVPEYVPSGDLVNLTPSSTTYYAMSFTTTAAIDITKLQVYVRRTTLTGGFYLRLMSDSGGLPGTVLASALCNADGPFRWVTGELSYSAAATTRYWVSVEPTGSLTGLEWAAAVFGSAQTEHAAVKSAGSWSTYGDSKYKASFRVNDGAGTVGQPVVRFVEYKGALYAFTQSATDTGKMLLNGARGVATGTQTSTTLQDTTKNFGTTQFVGCVVKIVDGTGAGQYRTISSHTTTTLTVSEAWDITPVSGSGANSSQYVILGSNLWTELFSGQFVGVTDVLHTGKADDDFLYICQGDSTVLKRYLWYCGTDSAAHEVLASDGTNKARLLYQHGGYIYRYFRDAGEHKVQWSPRQEWGTNLNFRNVGWVQGADNPNMTPTDIGQVNGFCSYDNTLLMFTNKRIYAVNRDSFTLLDVNYQSMEDEHNGVNPTVWNGMLYFPLGYGLERMIRSQVDDIGPNRDDGLPPGRQGYIAAMVPAVDGLYMAIDAGAAGTSSILVFNGMGYHELLRAQNEGSRIRAMAMQVVPGLANRLWYGEGNSIRYVKLPAKTSNPFKETGTGLVYNAGAYLITSWIDLGLAEADKYWKELTLVTDNLSAGSRYISAYYQTDAATDDDDWTPLPTDFTTSPSQTVPITSDYSLVAKRIRFKLVFSTLTSTETPRLLAWAVKSISRMEVRFAYTVNVLVAGMVPTIDGFHEEHSTTEILSQLDSWAGPGQAPLTLSTIDPSVVSKRVFLESCSYIAPVLRYGVKPSQDKYIVTLRFIEA